MTDDESTETSAQAKKNEAVFLLLVRIVRENGAIVVEDRFDIFKRDAMLPFVGRVLALVPFEPQIRNELEV